MVADVAYRCLTSITQVEDTSSVYIFLLEFCVLCIVCFILYTEVKVWILLIKMWVLRLLFSNSMNCWFTSLVFSVLHKCINSEIRNVQLFSVKEDLWRHGWLIKDTRESKVM